MKYPKLSLLKFGCLVALLSAGASAFAGEAKEGPGVSGGGGTVCTIGTQEKPDCSKLLDLDMKEGRIHFDQLAVYTLKVEPVLKALDDALPEFAKELRETLTTKRWYLTDAKIPQLSQAANGSDLPMQQVAIQYQDSREVWIEKSWFKGSSQEQQAAIIFHELAVGLKLKAEIGADDDSHDIRIVTDHILYRDQINIKITMGAVRQLVEDLLSGDFDFKAIREELLQSGFGFYMTNTELGAFQVETKSILTQWSNACDLENTYDQDNTPRNRALAIVYNALHRQVSSYSRFAEEGVGSKVRRHKLSIFRKFLEHGNEQIYYWYYDLNHQGFAMGGIQSSEPNQSTGEYITTWYLQRVSRDVESTKDGQQMVHRTYSVGACFDHYCRSIENSCSYAKEALAKLPLQ